MSINSRPAKADHQPEASLAWRINADIGAIIQLLLFYHECANVFRRPSFLSGSLHSAKDYSMTTRSCRSLVCYIAFAAFAACGAKQGPGSPVEKAGYIPLPLSNDLFRPGAVIVDNLTLGRKPLAPEIVCSDVQSIGAPADDKSDDVHEGPAGDWSQSAELNFKASAEAKVLEVVKAKAGGGASFKVTANLTNTRLIQHTTATLLARVHDGKRQKGCTCAIELDEKTSKRIVQAVITADVIFSITRSDGANVDASVDLQQVTAELGANFSVSDSSSVKGSKLTVAYRPNQEDELIHPEGTSCEK